MEELEKEVVSALRYFKTVIDKMVVDRKVLEMLPGSASKVLEAVVPIVQLDPKIQNRCVLFFILFKKENNFNYFFFNQVR